MSEHYYSAQPNSQHKYREFQTSIRGVELKLKTDAGVFSRDKVDTGSRLLIEGVRLAGEVRKVLDLGCGYGPIGLTLAKLMPEATVYMVDINERAVELAQSNAKANGVTNVVIMTSDGFSALTELQFDLIVTNPPIRAGKQVIYPLIEQAPHHLNAGGWLAAVIATKQGAKSLEKKMTEVFGNVTEWEKGSGFRVAASQK